jgi:predicted RNase H-like HicB family nuclease
MTAKKKTRLKRNPAAILLSVDLGRETDGRYFADIPNLPGVMAYGKSKDEALRNVQALALRVIADMLEGGELKQASISFAVA